VRVKYSITLSEDKLTAYLSVSDDFSVDADTLSEDGLRHFLASQGIRFGIQEAVISQVLNQGFGSHLEVARGIIPLKGADAYFESLVASRQKKYHQLCEQFHHRSRISASDFRPLLVRPRLPVLKKNPATRGAPGLTVTGVLIPGLWGDDCEPPAMANLVPSPDEKNLWLSACKGMCLFDLPHFIEVRPLLLLERDLKASLSFDGIVVVLGHIFDQVRLRATDDVFITDVVEASVVISMGNIYLQQGVKGKNTAVLRAAKNVSLNFAEHATLEVGGELQAHSLFSCHTYTLGNCIADFVQGGETFSAQHLISEKIGSRGISTAVYGGFPDYLESAIEIVEQQCEELKERLAQIEAFLSNPQFLVSAEKQVLRQHYYYQRPCLKYSLQKQEHLLNVLYQRSTLQKEAFISASQGVMGDTAVVLCQFEHYQDKFIQGPLTYTSGRYGIIIKEANEEKLR
jgi:uncharacterized protein